MKVTCEQVSDGHPDKICDQISDAILTECLAQDKGSRVAAETLAKGYDIVIAGEISTTANIEVNQIVADVLIGIGLKDHSEYKVINLLSQQSGDIALGVDLGGAGDQGMMYGYASSETSQMLPIPYVIATEALKRLRAQSSISLLPDSKSQVTFDYEKNRIDTFLISTQHVEDASVRSLRDYVSSIMVDTARSMGYNTDFKRLVNPTGRFVIGGTHADSGLTGRKIIADSYGGVARHGGGAFSGKDPTKVDRSGAYKCRNVAKRIVHEGLADKCEVQVAYAIGVAEPVSVFVETFRTEHVDIKEIESRVFAEDFRPQSIIKEFGLLDVDYRLTSTFGHFGRDVFPWEQT